MYIIYKHTNKINNKCYIGQTIHSLKLRCGNNGNGYKKCTKFYNAILKYGWDNFTHEIIMKNLTKIEADFWERYYISFYNSIENGYNIEIGGKTEGNQYKKKVYQYDLNGNFIKEFKSASQAALSLGKKGGHSSIIRVCKQKPGYKTAYGYIWKFKSENLTNSENLAII